MLRWVDPEGAYQDGSLFAVLAALARDEIAAFPALRPHQREPWHAFLVQVAAMALIRTGLPDPPDDERAWRELLVGLTPDWPGGEAWELVVDDWTKPALLQPPVKTAANRGDYRSRLDTPDMLDMLVTSKNHDVKQARMAAAREEDWLFALVTLQTTEGFLGAGNYGISRMNGGFASRMALGIRPSASPSAAWRRDMRRLATLSRGYEDTPDRWRRGLPLLWLQPWDGTDQLAYDKLDELYVEICRRVRLLRDDGNLVALAANSKVARVAAAELNGRTNDPWAPLKADRSASVTPTAAGFGYRQVTRLLDPKHTVPAMLGELAPDDDAEGLALVAAGLVRGQGKTEGLHRRAVPIAKQVARGLRPKEFLDRVARVANLRMQEAGKAQSLLRLALFCLVQGGPDKPRLDDAATARKVDPWTARFESAVDRVFFDDAFWAEVDARPGPHGAPWRKRLRDMAGEAFETAAEAAPRTENRRIRAGAKSRNLLDATFRRFVEEDDGR